MDPRFLARLAIILQSEGGYCDRPGDPGGPTNQGVTMLTFSTYLGLPATVSELKAITPTMVAEIYRSEFWEMCHADKCPPGVDLMVFDAAVNSGPARAIRWLQQAIGVAADGHYGPVTAAALAAAQPGRVITLYQNLRLSFLHAQPDAADNPGWFTRVVRTAALAQSLAEANPTPAN